MLVRQSSSLARVYVGCWQAEDKRVERVSSKKTEGRDTCTALTEAAGARARVLVLEKPETAKGAGENRGVGPTGERRDAERHRRREPREARKTSK